MGAIGGRWLKGGGGGTPRAFRLTLFFSPADKGDEGESGIDMLTTYMGKHVLSPTNREPRPTLSVFVGDVRERERGRRQEEHEAASLLFVIAGVCIIARDRPLLFPTATVKGGKKAEKIPNMLRVFQVIH